MRRAWPLMIAGLVGTASVSAAQTTAAPPASQREEHASSDTSTARYEVDGVRVIHRRVTANDVVAANLYLLGGTRQATAETVGIEPFLLEASERGTAKYPLAALRRAMSSTGSVIAVQPDVDWTVFGLRATTAGFDSTWMVLSDRLMAPTLDANEVELVRGQYLAAVRQRRDSPDALVEYLADSVAFPGQPYGLAPGGTEATIARLTVDDLRRYQREQMVTSRMLLVVVGNVGRPRVERLVRATLSKLPRGSYAWTLPQPGPALPATVAVEARSLPTNYIRGYYPGPAASSPDHQALRIATAVLSGRLFAEIRSRRNLTYAVSAPFVDRAITAGGLYVTTVAPNEVLAIMRQEIRDLQEGYIDPFGLAKLVQTFITDYFLDNETNADQANLLARAELYRGDYRLASRFVDELRRVTPSDVRRVARQYMKNIRFAYVGDPSKLSRGAIGGF